MTKNDLKVGMIIKHAYRKTLTFKITEVGRTGKLLVKRVVKTRNGYEVQEGFKGYALANRDYSKGLITIVDPGNGKDLSSYSVYKTMSRKDLLKKIESMTDAQLDKLVAAIV